MPHILSERPHQKQSTPDSREGGVVISLDLARAARMPPVPLSRAPKPCGHERHVGPCPACQQAQLARWRSQLASAETLREKSAAAVYGAVIGPTAAA
jgi:hypothetical protein